MNEICRRAELSAALASIATEGAEVAYTNAARCYRHACATYAIAKAHSTARPNDLRAQKTANAAARAMEAANTAKQSADETLNRIHGAQSAIARDEERIYDAYRR